MRVKKEKRTIEGESWVEANVFVVKLRDRGLYWNKTWKSTLSWLLLESTVLGGEQISTSLCSSLKSEMSGDLRTKPMFVVLSLCKYELWEFIARSLNFRCSLLPYFQSIRAESISFRQLQLGKLMSPFLWEMRLRGTGKWKKKIGKKTEHG